MDDTKNDVRAAIKAKLPHADVTRVDVSEAADAEGQSSLYIRIVLKKDLSRGDMKQSNSVIDSVRTSLIGKGEERFPYFSFISEQDEKELSDLKS